MPIPLHDRYLLIFYVQTNMAWITKLERPEPESLRKYSIC